MGASTLSYAQIGRSAGASFTVRTRSVFTARARNTRRAGNAGRTCQPPTSTRQIARMADPRHPIFLSYRERDHGTGTDMNGHC
jgi:hypothetical protein